MQYELPDDCYVWYEPRVKGLYPDFIILGLECLASSELN